MSKQRLSRRALLRSALFGSVGLALAACAPQVVKETVVVEVEKEKVVKETVVVEAASQQTTVRYHCRAGAALAPGSEYPTHQNRLIEFQDEHPEIKVVREDIANTDLHDYYVKLATMVVGGTVGDMTVG
jgi:ABC-type glycerol-3-phosphate transport system substrate-binding protein